MADSPSALNHQAELWRMVVEIREMLVQFRHDQGDARAGAREGRLVIDREKLICLGDAVALMWGESAAAKSESRRAYTSILEMFATSGLNGVVLETTVKWKKWRTSREAVERFVARTFGTRTQPATQARRNMSPRSD